MATALSSANVVTLTDRIGAIWKRNLDVAAATAATDVSGTGMTDLIADLQTLGVAKNYLYTGAALTLQTAALAAAGLLSATDLAGFVRVLHSDLGGLDAYATAQTIQYYQYFASLCGTLGITISAANTFKATNQTLATFTVLTATTGTFVGTGVLDTTLYAPSQCELIITDAIGSSTTVSLTMQKADGTTEVKTVALTTGDTLNTVRAIGSPGDVYKDCTAIAVTGATASDAFTVRTTILRSPAV